MNEGIKYLGHAAGTRGGRARPGQFCQVEEGALRSGRLGSQLGDVLFVGKQLALNTIYTLKPIPLEICQ